MQSCFYWTHKFPFSSLTLAEYKGDIIVCSFGNDTRFLQELLRRYLPDVSLVRKREPLQSALNQLGEYFAGNRKRFQVSVSFYGTEFQRRVWAQLKKIKYGETASYGDIARALGDKNLMRAVGGANGANPISIIIPCHRVIGANGKLVGYGGGMEMKRKLLNLEGALPR